MPDRTIERLDLVGGSLALDFANTVSSRSAPGHDYLGGYDDLLDWSRRTHSLERDQLDALAKKGAANPTRAAAVLDDAHRRREAVFAVFSAIAGGRSPAGDPLHRVLVAYGNAVATADAALEPTGTALKWDTSDLASPLQPIAYDAGRLLLSDATGRVKECPNCRWLFLDQSRNRTRRWCDMQVCGSREKMRRYRRAIAPKGRAASH